MNLEVTGHLSDEDLGRWRKVSAYRKLMEMGHPEITLEMALNIFEDYESTLCDPIERYDIEPGQCPMISTVDGAIVERY